MTQPGLPAMVQLPARRAYGLLASPFLGPVLLVAVFFLARYLRLDSFGWYEDDLTILPQAVTLSPAALLAFVGEYIVGLQGHARPLSNTLIYLLGNFGWRLGGLAGQYAIGFLVEALNIVLFYELVRRVWGSTLAMLAGFAYVLYAADTTQVFLTHSLGAQPSITLLLLALDGYLSHRYVAAYALAFLILFSYETPFAVFLAAPLLQRADGRSTLGRLAVHAVVLGAMVAMGYLIRTWVGEERVTGQPLLSLVQTSLTHVVAGPLVSLGTYAYRPLQVLSSGSWVVWAAVMLSLPCFFYIVQRLSREVESPRERPPANAASLRNLWRPLIVGFLMLGAAYALALTVRPYAISGRDTRVHLAAVLGAALVVGTVANFGLHWARRRRHWFAGPAILAALFALWFGYGFVIQEDYAKAWDLQRSFWPQLLPQIEDAGPGTVVVIDPIGLTDTRQIGANTWNLPRLLEQMYEIPSDWTTPPRVFRALPEWRDFLILPDGTLRIDGDTTQSPTAVHTTTDWDHLIVIHTGDGVARRTEPLVVDAVAYPLAAAGELRLGRLPRLLLYDLLIGSPSAP